MNALDWILLGIGVLGLGRGIMRGAISQIFGIVGVVGGFYVASNYYRELALELGHGFPNLEPLHAQVIGFIVLFLLAWWCVALTGFLISRILQKTGLGFIDRLWGAAVGVAKGVVLAVILISVLTFFLSYQNPLLTGSILTPYVQQAARLLVKATPAQVQSMFKQKQEELKRYLDQKENRKQSRALLEKEVKI